MASPLHLAEVQLALQDVDIYLRGTHFEASHRLAVAQAALRDARRQVRVRELWTRDVSTTETEICSRRADPAWAAGARRFS